MQNAAFQSVFGDIIVDEVVPGAPETIWRALAAGKLLGGWIDQPPIGFKPVPGSRFTIQTMPGGALNHAVDCKVLEAIPNQTFDYSWKASRGSFGHGPRLDTFVTWTLMSVVRGTRVRLVHSGFVLPENDAAFRAMSEAWRTVVPKLEMIANGTRPHRSRIADESNCRVSFPN